MTNDPRYTETAGLSGAHSDPDGFGVSVDLSRYFSDERARCYVWVTRTRRVQWLTERLRRRLRLPASDRLVLLTTHGLLLPDDPLALLRPHDTIRAIPCKDDWFDEGDICNYKQLVPRNCETSDQVKTDKENLKRQEVSAVDTLHAIKRRALALLEGCASATTTTRGDGGCHDDEDGAADCDECSGDGDGNTQPAPPPPAVASRRRRRVRRRPRRPQTVSPSPHVNDERAESAGAACIETVTSPSEESREPRLVHALC